MSAPNLLDPAAARVAVVDKLSAAVQALQALVERDRVAEEAAAEIETSFAVVVARKTDLGKAIESALDDATKGDLGALVVDFNQAEAMLEAGTRARQRASAELGTARAERAKAQAVVDELRARLRKLVE